jgi:hypothetical protein
MTIKLPKKTARSAEPAEVTVREALAEMGWKSDAELMREAVDSVIRTDPAKVIAQVKEQEEAARLVPKIPAPMSHREMFDGPRELASLRKEVVKLQTLLVAKSSPPIEPPQPTAQAAPEQVQAAGHNKKGRNDAMRPLIEKAQKNADNPEDAAEVFNIIKRWALSKEPPAPLMGDLNSNADAVLWENSNGVTQALNKKALAKRLGRRRALTAPVPEAGQPKLQRIK